MNNINKVKKEVINSINNNQNNQNFNKKHMENELMMIKNNNLTENYQKNSNVNDNKGTNHNDDDDDNQLDDEDDDEDIINICHLNENGELDLNDDDDDVDDDLEMEQNQQPSGQRWDPLGADDEDNHSMLFNANTKSQNELLNFDDLNRIKVLEDEQEMLSTSLLALTTHFAQVQFRLRQIVDAPINDRDNLLAALEEFAFRGVIPTSTETIRTPSGDSSSSSSSSSSPIASTKITTTTTKSINKNTNCHEMNDDKKINIPYHNRNHPQLKLIEQLKMDLLRVENKNKNQHHQHQQPDHPDKLSSEMETEIQKSESVLLINELKQKLEDQSSSSAEDQNNQTAAVHHSMELIKKQKLIIDELTNKLKLNVNLKNALNNDSHNDLTKLSTDALRLQIDQAIGEFVGPIKMKETLVAQLKTQILDLERFVSHLQCETINTKVLLKQLMQTNNNTIQIMNGDVMVDDSSKKFQINDSNYKMPRSNKKKKIEMMEITAAGAENNEDNLQKNNSITFEKVKLLNKPDGNQQMIKRNSSSISHDHDDEDKNHDIIKRNQKKIGLEESSMESIDDGDGDGDGDGDDDDNKYSDDSESVYATYNSKMAQDRLRSTIQLYDDELKKSSTSTITNNKSLENNERIESKLDEKSSTSTIPKSIGHHHHHHQRRHSIGTSNMMQTKIKPTQKTTTTTSIISKASTLMNMFTLMQFGCGGSAASANASAGGIIKKDNQHSTITNNSNNRRSTNQQNLIKNFRKNTLKTTMKGNHWGDLRAQLEIDVQEIVMLLSATGCGGMGETSNDGTRTTTTTMTTNPQQINLNRHQKYHQEYHQRKLNENFNDDNNNNNNNKSHKHKNPDADDDDDLSEDCYCFQNINNGNNQKQSNKYKRQQQQQQQHQQMELITLVRKHFAMTLKKLMEHGLRGGAGSSSSSSFPYSSSTGLIVPFIECFLSNPLSGTAATAVTNHYDYGNHQSSTTTTTTLTNDEWINEELDIDGPANDNKQKTSKYRTLNDYDNYNDNNNNNVNHSTSSMHIWDFILEYYYIKNGDKLNETPARCLSQSFNLEITDSNTLMTPPPPSPSPSSSNAIVGSSNIRQQQQQQQKKSTQSGGGNENILSSQFITNKQSLLYGIGNIIEMHRPYKRSQNAHFKALISAGLNAKRLTQWLHLIYQNNDLIQMYYTEWSYAARTGFKDAIKTIDKLSEFPFDLPIDLAIRQFKNIKDIFL